MKYDLALDGGGTKVTGILYDENFCPVRTYRAGSIRSATMPKEYIRNNIEDLIDGLQLRGLHLGCVHGAGAEGLQEALQQNCQVDTFAFSGEVEIGLAAAGLKEGYLAVAGTGATLGCRWNGKGYHVGGYGAIVYDAGSGYWIAREAFAAAIADYELRGEPTLLKELICQKLGNGESLPRSIFTIYRPQIQPPITSVTGCAPLVSEAAYAGDKVACDILLRAGRVLADQIMSVQRMNQLPMDLPVSISGGVWHGHPMIFDAFCQRLREHGMTGTICQPMFEPVVGAILLRIIRQQGEICHTELERFQTMYQNFQFQR